MRECWVSFIMLRAALVTSAVLSCSSEGDRDICVCDVESKVESNRVCLSCSGESGDEEGGGVRGDGVGAGGVEETCIDRKYGCVSWF